MSRLNELIIEACAQGYRAEFDGTVFHPSGEKVTKHLNSEGYLEFKYKGRRLATHRFIAYQLYGKEALEAQCVRHLDDIKINNKFENVMPGTCQENRLDIPLEIRIARSRKGAITRSSEGYKAANAERLAAFAERKQKLTFVQAEEIRSLYVPWKITMTSLAERFGVSFSCIQRIINCKTYREEVDERRYYRRGN